MKNQKLIHDRAEAMAFDLLATISNCLREEEWQDAFAEFYAITAAGLKRYDRQAARMRRFGGAVGLAQHPADQPAASNGRPVDWPAAAITATDFAEPTSPAHG
jgi:hypothetical protein